MNGTTLEIRAEVADSPAARARGLMGRTSVPPGTGMLFIYPGAGRWGGYWMKDTLVPLDIAFIREGVVTEIFAMRPCDRDPCPFTTPDGPYDSALEVAAGTLARAGIVAGSRVSIAG